MGNLGGGVTRVNAAGTTAGGVFFYYYQKRIITDGNMNMTSTPNP